MLMGMLVSVLAGQLIGSLWYSKYMFGNLWFKHTFPGETLKPGGPICYNGYALSFVGQTTLTLLISFVLPFLQVGCVIRAIKAGIGLAGLVAIIDIPHMAFNQRSFVLFFIDHFFDVVLLATMCGIMAFFTT